MDVDENMHCCPRHFIHRLSTEDNLPPVLKCLKPGDELLEANGRPLYGRNYTDVIEILKALPQHVTMICARKRKISTTNFYQPTDPVDVYEIHAADEKLFKAKSEVQLLESCRKSFDLEEKILFWRSRSLDTLENLAIWSNVPDVIELEKGDRGLGFSLLEYQSVNNPTARAVVIRSLVPRGAADLDGRILPGYRLVSVNDVDLRNASLETASEALKMAPRGKVKLGIAKLLTQLESVCYVIAFVWSLAIGR
ncbi:unnamed protein product [Soboliphyme baturini]|uniref:PDZ domain-containing protein n=1 Tax=Soboliphyme baturini TaxID=241478 RepID=A0A183J4Q0_9BILA|nr:unnamed protein product [Soboliphyme baturini]